MASNRALTWMLAGLLTLWAGTTLATPITPSRDDEVIERLPALPQRASRSSDPSVALQEARALLATAHREGDPRLAGRAVARLSRWSADRQSPPELQLTLASAEQYLHQFDRSLQRLQALLQRDPRQAQAWLMVATLHRVQGRYADSDAACRALQGLRVHPYAEACLAENLALRGGHDSARRSFQTLIASVADPGRRAWLLTSLAELEQRAGRNAASDRAWRQSLQAERDSYAAIAYADFLLDNGRAAEAWTVLQPEARSDAALLRQATAARRSQRPEAAALEAELRERFALADQRTESSGHDRERAMMALEIERDPAAALRAARQNVQRQREPIDVLLLLRCAAAAKDAGAREEALRLARDIGLRDVRLEAL